MKNNIKRLINQYMECTGTKSLDINSEMFIEDFANWIRERNRIGSEYPKYLDYMGLNYSTSNCSEVGKCKFDTVVKPFDTTLITTETCISGVNSDRIITGYMRVINGVPVLVRKRNEDIVVNDIPNRVIHTYMTQNPYTYEELVGWDHLHNSRKRNIIVGTYGSIHDKDTTNNIRQIEYLRSKLSDNDYLEDYFTNNGSYFYIIATDRMEHKLVKRLYR